MHIPAPHLRCLGQGDASKEKKIIRVCIVHMIGVERCHNNVSNIHVYCAGCGSVCVYDNKT